MCRNLSGDVGISSYIHHEVNTRPTNETQVVLGNGDVTFSGVRKGGSGVGKISIADTGCGISIENLEKIFDPFFTTKPPEKGTGLGLHNVREIIKKYRG